MSRKYRRAARTGWKILVVDDSPDILESTRRLLDGEGHEVQTAADGRNALDRLREETFDLIVVDYFMPGMTGEELVRTIREVNRLTQIILSTGYSGEKPARTMMRELEIQGYHDKSEGAQKLLLWVDSALNARRNLLALETQRSALRQILDLGPELHAARSVEQVVETLTSHLVELVRLWTPSAAARPEPETAGAAREHAEAPVDGVAEILCALSDRGEAAGELRVRSATGRFAGVQVVVELEGPVRSLIEAAVGEGSIRTQEHRASIPLTYGGVAAGVIHVEGPASYTPDLELLGVFASQASAALHRALLGEVATTDPLTGAFLPEFTGEQLRHFIKRGHRRGDPLSVVMIDLEPAAGAHEATLVSIADLIRATGRDTDLIGRRADGGFIMILPDTPPAGAIHVADRLLRQVQRLPDPSGGHRTAVRLHVGLGTLLPDPDDAPGEQPKPNHFDLAASVLLERGRAGLRRAKATGRPGETPAVRWSEVLQAGAA
jgi:two-component system, cell cycle response regulator